MNKRKIRRIRWRGAPGIPALLIILAGLIGVFAFVRTSPWKEQKLSFLGRSLPAHSTQTNSSANEMRAGGNTAHASSVASGSPPAILPQAPLNPAQKQRAVKMIAAQPLQFEPNQGQADPRVKFLSHGTGYTLFLTQQQAVLAFAPQAKHGVPSKDGNGRAEAQDGLQSDPLRLKFVGAAASGNIAGEDLLRSQTNYFVGRDPKRWRRGVPNYAAVDYKGIYPGIDARFHGNGQRLEFDFDIAPGADPSKAELQIDGARAFHLDRHGNIVLTANEAARVILGKPDIYQEIAGQRREITGNFVVHRGNRVGFSVGPYDRSRPLVIDPTFTLAYSTYLGGTLTDSINGIAVGPLNAAYVVGTTSSTTFPTTTPQIPTSNGLQTTCPACTNGGVAFVAKFDSDQNLVYYTYFGANNPNVMPDELGTAKGNAIAVDSSGNAYITGHDTFPSNFPVTESSGQSGYIFVAELSDVVDSNGNPQNQTLLNSTLLGGANGLAETGNGISLDGQGNVYIVGTTVGSGLATANAYQSTPAGSQSAFAAKINFSASPILTYFTYLLGSSSDVGSAIAVGPNSGNAYVVGATQDPTLPTATNAGQTNFPSSSTETAGFVAALNSAGSALTYFSYLGGLGSVSGNIGFITSGTSFNALALDGSENVYVTGLTNETDLPTTTGTVGAASTVCPSGPCPKAFVAEFTPGASGPSSIPLVTYFGGLTGVTGTPAPASTSGNSIALDPAGDIFLTGAVATTDFPEPGISPGVDAFLSALPCHAEAQRSDNACAAAFLLELAPGATSVSYSTYLGGAGTTNFVNDSAKGIALDNHANVYIVGSTNSGNFPTAGANASPLIASSPSGINSSGFFAMFQFPTSAPAISFSPSTANFGTTPAGQTPSPITLRVTNASMSQTLTATYSLTSSTTPNPFSITPQICSYNLSQLLPPGFSCNFTLSFSPPASGTYSATLTFVDNAPQGTPDPNTSGEYDQAYILTGTSGGAGPTLTSITVTPTNPSITIHGTEQFTATGNYSSGPSQNITNTVTWTSSDTGIATISNASGTQGLATGVAAGPPTTTIAAGLSGVTGSTTLTVTSSTTSPINISDPETVTVTDVPLISDNMNSEMVHVTDIPILRVYTTIAISPSPSSFNSSSSANGVATQPYASATFTASGGAGGTLALTETGALPSGITFVDNGNDTATLSGTPAAAGTYSFSVTATDSLNDSTTQSGYALTIAPPPSPANAIYSSPVNFGNVMTGSTTTAELMVSNSAGAGALSFTVVSAAISGSGSPFSVPGTVSNCGSFTGLPVALAPGQTCNIDLQFAPTATTGETSGELLVVDTSANSNLSGTTVSGGMQRSVFLEGFAATAIGNGQLTTIAGSTAAPPAQGCIPATSPVLLCNAGYTGDGGAATSAELWFPLAVAAGSDGTVYVADERNAVIRAISPGGTISTFATLPSGAPRVATAVTVNNGAVVYADSFSNIFSGPGQQTGGNGPGNTSIEALATDGNGNLYVLSTVEGDIEQISGPNGIVASTTFGGPTQDLVGASLFGLAVDSSGNVYTYSGVSGSYRNEIIEISSSGAVTAISPSGLVSGGVIGSSLAMDSSGNFYVLSEAGMVQEFTPSTGALTLIAGTGVNGYNVPNGPTYNNDGPFPAVQTDLNQASGVAVGQNGAIYIADTENNLVREVVNPNTPTGSQITVTPKDTTTGTSPVTLTFNSVTQSGMTTLTTSSSGPAPPAGFQLGAGGVYYDISTTAVYTPPVTVCISFAAGSFPAGNPQLFHYEGGQWVNVTNAGYPTSTMVCGTVSSLSPFALFQSIGTTAQTITFGTLPNVTYGAAPITLSATASSGLAVSYTVTGPATLSGNTLTITGAGIVAVTANQGGNTDYAAATPVSQSFTVSTAVLTVTATNASMVFGSAVPNLTYTIAGFVNGDSSTVVSGTATETTTATNASAPGTYAITFSTEALTEGNYTFRYVNGALTVTQAGTSVQLSTSANGSVADGTPVVLTAKVVPATSGTPTGTVTFLNGSTSLGSAALSQAVATLTTSTLPSGSNNITAQYSGDTNFTTSTSPVETVSVNSPDYTVSANPSTLTIAAGQSASTTITVTPEGYSGTVSFSCGTLPSYVTCAFNPASGSVTFASGATAAQTIALTVSVAATTSALELQQPFLLAMVIPLGLLALLPIAGGPRKRLRFYLGMVLLAITVAGVVAGCGAGNNSSGTSNLPPAGNQSFTVTASGSSSSGTISHQLQLTIDVTN